MKNNKAKFYSGLWQLQLSQLENTYRVVNEFLNDKNAQEAYLQNKHKDKTSLFDSLKKIEDEVQSLPEAPQLFRRQMIIAEKIILEQICKEFLESIYIAKNKKNEKTPSKYLIEKIEELSDLKIPEEIKAALLQLINKRNTVAHEITQDQIDENYFSDSLSILNTIIEILETVCKNNGILDVTNPDDLNDDEIY
jgi:hypothetical protein